jgi:hypothetical protein
MYTENNDPYNFYYHTPQDQTQTHVHEFLGSTKLAGECHIRHDHRFSGVTGEAIPISGGGHKHTLFTNVDFFKNHYHQLAAETGPAIPVGGGRHVHFAEARTTFDYNHIHQVIFATLIESPSS